MLRLYGRVTALRLPSNWFSPNVFGVANRLGYRNVWWGMGPFGGGAFGRQLADVYYTEIFTPPEHEKSIPLLLSILRGI
jgi:hypothetical protein